jgi:hypothetical protein
VRKTGHRDIWRGCMVYSQLLVRGARPGCGLETTRLFIGKSREKQPRRTRLGVCL